MMHLLFLAFLVWLILQLAPIVISCSLFLFVFLASHISTRGK